MKRPVRTLLFGLLAALAFTACNGTTLNVPLADFSVTINVAVDTAGQVVYPKNPAEFQEPVLNVASITLSGYLTYEANAGSDSLTLTFYASADDPQNHSGCSDMGSFYLCDPTGEKAISNEGTFPENKATPISLGNPNPDVLTTGINRGKIWIGALVQDSLALDTTLNFTDMVAHVTLF